MKYNFNIPFVDLDGNPTEGSQGKTLANVMANGSSNTDPLKFWEFAVLLNRGEAIELDTQDKEKVESFIKNATKLTNGAKAQLLLVLSQSK